MSRTISSLAAVLLFFAGCSPSVAPPAESKVGTSDTKATTSDTKPVEKKANGIPAAVVDDGAQDNEDELASARSNKPDMEDEAAEKGEPLTADELMEEAGERIQQEDIEGCLAKVKQALEVDPEHQIALIAAVNVSRMAAETKLSEGDKEAAYPHLRESAVFLRRLLKAYPEMQSRVGDMAAKTYYNEACAQAVDGETEQALATLTEAFEAGYDNFEELEADDDLASVRELPEFAPMLSDQVEKAEEAARAFAQEELAKGETYDFDFSLPNLEGKTVTLAEFKGKVVIVDIWGTWCPPCRMEVPHFVALQDEFKEQGLEIVGVNYESGDDDEVKEAIDGFLKTQPINYTLLIGDDATKDQIPDMQGYPTTLFIDRTGKVRLQIVGYHPKRQLAALVKELLAEPAAEEDTEASEDAASGDEPEADEKADRDDEPESGDTPEAGEDA
ncbi:MAG: redoxin domain-containing protein [Pirellulales bacterium]